MLCSESTVLCSTEIFLPPRSPRLPLQSHSQPLTCRQSYLEHGADLSFLVGLGSQKASMAPVYSMLNVNLLLKLCFCPMVRSSRRFSFFIQCSHLIALPPLLSPNTHTPPPSHDLQNVWTAWVTRIPGSQTQVAWTLYSPGRR